MASLRIELNHAGVRQLLRAPGVKADLERRARRIAAAAGPGHDIEMWDGRSRVRATVRTATFAARHNEAVNRSLSKAVDAGRG